MALMEDDKIFTHFCCCDISSYLLFTLPYLTRFPATSDLRTILDINDTLLTCIRAPEATHFGDSSSYFFGIYGAVLLGLLLF